MTQRRNNPDAISNYFDWIVRGIGHRGSSFMDIDAVTHDGKTGRVLIQEFKQPGEKLDPAQQWTLEGLAQVSPQTQTVWFVRRREDGRLDFGVMGQDRRARIITITEYQQRFRQWWEAGRDKREEAAS